MEVRNLYKPIGDSLEILNGFPAKSSYFNTDAVGLPLIRIRNILKGYSETYYSGNYQNKYLINKGDILIGMDGEFNISKWKGVQSLLNQRVCKIVESSSPFGIEYIFYQLHIELTRIEARTPSTTVKHLSIRDIRKSKIFCPPLPEQQKIAEILSTVDEQISTTQDIIDKSKELKKGLMQKLFSEGKGHTEFKDTKIGRIPKDWEVVKLGDIVKYSQGIQVDLDLQKYEPFEDYIKFLRIENYTQNSQDFRFIPLPSKKDKIISKDDVVVVRYGATAGTVCRGFNGVLANNLFKVTPNEKLDNGFLFRYLSSLYSYLQSLMSGGAMPALNFGMLNLLYTPLPSLPEQQKIAEILSEADAKIEKEEQEKAKLEELKKGLMQQLLTGNKRVKV